MFDWLLGLEGTTWSDPRAALAWRWPMPAWGWLLAVGAAVAFTFWTYRRLVPSTPWMITLSLLRTALILLVVALLLGPLLLVEREVTEEACVVLLVDRSASMQIQDAAAPDGAGGFVSRDAVLQDALRVQSTVFGADTLGRGRRLIWLGFDAATFEMPAPGAGGPGSWPPPTGQGTALRSAVEDALQRSAGQHLLGVVLFSDGRSPQMVLRATLDPLRARGAVLYSVPLGGAATPLDIAVSRVEAPDKAFVDDEVPVTVWIERAAATAVVEEARVTVRVVDEASGGRVLDEVTLEEDSGPARLRVRWPNVGPATWRVEAEYAGTDAEVHEAVTSNNRRSVHLEFIDRPVRVLYVEDLPRWEYRYLKNLLVREKSIDSSVLLRSSDLSFAQEGDRSIRRLPTQRREMEPYDVILIGDVDPATFSDAHWNLIREQVARFGAGLMWIAGHRHTPTAYAGSPLEALLPLRDVARVRQVVTDDAGLRVQRAGLADALSVLRLRDADRDRGDDPWPAHLPGLRWVQDPGALKPAAETLARAVGATAEVPLIVAMRYGAGQVLFVGTDETWRWRYGRGELYFEQFWTQLIQMLGRGRAAYDGAAVRLDVSHRRPRVGAPVLITARFREAGQGGRSVAVTLQPVAPTSRGENPGLRVPLTPSVDGAEMAVSIDDGGHGTDYRATWRPTRPGRYLVTLTDPMMGDPPPTWGPIEVLPADDELRDVRPDHEKMARAAEATGGGVVDLAQLAELDRRIPQAPSSPDDLREPLWDSPLAFMGLMLLPTLEWIGRKWLRLA